MSTVNSLKAFMTTWAPVVEAVPAVIEALNKKDFYDKELAGVQAEIRKAIEQYETVVADQARATQAWEARLKGLQDQVAQAAGAVSEAQAQTRKKVSECNKRALEAESASAERVEAARQLVENEKIRLESVVGSARADAEAKIKAMNAEADEAEKRMVAVQKKLDALRSQLG